MVRNLITAALVFVAASAAIAQPEPPRRPASLQGGTTAASGSNAPLRLDPAKTAAPAAGQLAPPVTEGPLSEDAALDRVNNYMNSFRSLTADFVQLGADGRKYEGKLYVQKPGQMRFEYKPPATIEIISDGTTVAVRDKRLATQDNYLIGQTPLKFLLKERIDLRRDTRVLRVTSTTSLIRVTVEDTATLGGTSRITLLYDPQANELRQWVIVDPQGYETSVELTNLDTSRRPDPGRFRINLERLGTDSNK